MCLQWGGNIFTFISCSFFIHLLIIKLYHVWFYKVILSEEDIADAKHCQELCELFEDFGCEYWVYKENTERNHHDCLLLHSDERYFILGYFHKKKVTQMQKHQLKLSFSTQKLQFKPFCFLINCFLLHTI